MSPQGMPHHPSRKEYSNPPSWAFFPHVPHETRGLLDQDDISTKEMILYDVWTSTGPLC